MSYNMDRELGIYLHIPFCLNKCLYCDFLSFASTIEQREKYVDTIIKEINLYPKFKYKTVYFGGGTPSLLNIEHIQKILNSLNIDKNAEITLEINPKTVDFNKLKQFKQIGINRLSIGIQSFNNKYLKLLGRVHNSFEAINTFEMARKVGFDNISLDLMFALPEQNLNDLKNDLKILFSLKPEHISIYSLIWEEGTEFFKKLKSGYFSKISNDLEASMYELIMDEMEKNGYIHYEISNFSLPNKRAEHNTNYWKNLEYIGVGLGASGYYNNIRYKNFSTFSKYLQQILEFKKPIEESEFIDTQENEIYEYILGLRIIPNGINPKGKFIDICNNLVNRKLLMKNGSTYKLSRTGILLANDVFDKFI